MKPNRRSEWTFAVVVIVICCVAGFFLFMRAPLSAITETPEAVDLGGEQISIKADKESKQTAKRVLGGSYGKAKSELKRLAAAESVQVSQMEVKNDWIEVRGMSSPSSLSAILSQLTSGVKFVKGGQIRGPGPLWVVDEVVMNIEDDSAQFSFKLRPPVR